MLACYGTRTWPTGDGADADMRLTAALAICGVALSGCAIKRQPVMQPFADGQYFRLAQPLIYEFGSTGQTVTVPEGFVTDLASIPPIFFTILPKTDRHIGAAIVHDYLYWVQTCTRDEADKVLAMAMRESRVPAYKRAPIFLAVDWFGTHAWEANRVDRSRGQPRIVPIAIDLSPDVTWAQARQELVKSGAKPDTGNVSPNFCATARSAPRL